MAVNKKQWRDLSAGQRAGIVAAGAAELVLTAVSVRDLARRPAKQVRGPKWLWMLMMPVQPMGPISYLLLGRRN
jgi:hypothetical protein